MTNPSTSLKPGVVAHTTPPHWPADIPATRFAGSWISRSPEGCRVALLGLPDDLGVRLNHGRPGAAEGPRAFREALAKYGVSEPAWMDHSGFTKVFDAGDVVPAAGDSPEALHETHRRVTEASRAIASMGMFPIAIGGGHDLTFPFVRGVLEALPPSRRQAVEGIYFDAHLDVRETVGSGMPFRKLIEECGVKKLCVEGLNPLANSQQHMAWFRSRGGVIGLSHEFLNEPFFVSVDLDVLDASHAPGVSAMHPAGMHVEDLARHLTRLVGLPGLLCLDFMELSPPHDDRGRTARVAAHLFLVALSNLRRELR